MSHEHHISLQPCSFYHFASFINRQLDDICMYEMKQTRCRCIYIIVTIVTNWRLRTVQWSYDIFRHIYSLAYTYFVSCSCTCAYPILSY